MNRDQLIIRHIEGEEEIRKALLRESTSTVLQIIEQGDPEFKTLWGLQLIMNHLRDLCVNCSKCCETSDVDLNPYDIERMAAHLRLSQTEFVSKYTIPHPQIPAHFRRLKQKPCVFLKNQRCTLYSARPNMCMFFPFLTAIQEPAWQLYAHQNQVTISLPIWCSSGLKVKEVSDKLHSTLKRISPEDSEKWYRETIERLRKS